MKLWEVMRLLEENPTKVYEAEMHCGHTTRMRVDNGYYRFEIFNGEALIGQYRGDGAFNNNAGLYLDWHEVKQPVPWQEAIQAWHNKKNIYVKSGEYTFWHKASDFADELTIGWGEIQWGKWYVED